MAARFLMAALLLFPSVMGAAMPVEADETEIAAIFERELTNVSGCQT